MAEFEPTGVRLTAEGLGAYLADLEKARQATLGLGASGTQAGGGMNDLNMGTLITATTLGGVFANAIANAIGNIVQLSTAGIAMTSQLQDMRMNLESLAASEVIAAGATDNMADALEIAAPITDNLMEKIKLLSLASPFEYQQILQVFQMNKAFGQSIETSLMLTEAITNLGAVNKTIPGILQRVSYNFSQMAMVGKITGRDLRDLSMAGVDLKKMFKDQLGLTIDEVNAKLESGLITFETVSKAFAGYVDKYFGDAAQRASRTFSGLKSSFNDLAFFSSIDVFGGAMEKATAKMATFFDSMMQFVQGGGIKPIGAVLEVLTEQLMGLGEVAINAGASFADNFGEMLSGAASSAFAWGANIVIQLATGMIEGASSALAAAMDYISGMLSFWLSPGSPPKVAPDIDAWGTAAMSQFLSGFTNANFSVLKSIGGTLNTALSALVGEGEMEKSDQTRIFQGLSGDIAEVIAKGGSLEPVLSRIRDVMGKYGQQVADLTKSQFELGLATNKVREAEEALKKSREDETKANEDLIKATDEYNELAKAGASPEVLAAKRAEFEQAKKNRMEASKASKAAYTNLEASSKEAAALKEKTDLQSEFVQQLIELTKEQKEAKKAGGGGGGGGGKPPAAGGGPKLPNLDDANKEIGQAIERMKVMMNMRITQALAPFILAWERAKIKVSSAFESLAKTVGEVWEQRIKPVFEGMKNAIPPELITNIGWAAGVILTLGVAWGTVSAIVGTAAAVLGGIAAFLGSPIGLIVALIVAVGLFKTAWDSDWNGIRTTLTEFYNTTLLPMFTSIQTWMTTNLPPAIATLSAFWTNTLLPAMIAVGNWITTVLVPTLGVIWGWLSTNIPMAIQTLSSFWNNVLMPPMREVWGYISGSIIPLFQSFGRLIGAGFAVFAAGFAMAFVPVMNVLKILWGYISTVVLPVLSTLAKFFAGALVVGIRAVTSFLSTVLIPGWIAVMDLVSGQIIPGWLAVSDFLRGALSDALGGVSSFLTETLFPAFNKVQELVAGVFLEAFVGARDFFVDELVPGLTTGSDFFAKILKPAIQGVVDAIDNVIAAVGNMMAKLGEAKKALPDWLTPGSPTPWEMGLRGISAAMADLNRTGLPTLQTELIATNRAYDADAAQARLSLLPSGGASSTENRNYNLTLNTSMQPKTVEQGFDYFRLLAV